MQHEDDHPPLLSARSNNKRKGSDTTSILASNKNKRVKADAFTLESLRPFDFFITAPPANYSHIYPALSDWLEAIVNDDFSVDSNPFVVPTQDLISGYSAQWKGVVLALNDAKKTSDNWEKFSIVDKIISLSSSEAWEEKLEKYMKLQKDVWWVHESNKWFKSRCISYKEYLKTGTAAVCLELWYRFVWARYTYGIHESIRLKEASKVDNQNGLPTSPDNTRTNDVEGGDTHIKSLEEGDSIIELKDLGTGNDEDVEEDDEESDGDEHDVRTETEKDILEEDEDIGKTSEGETDTDGEMVVPGVVSLFFTHIRITNAIDETETTYFDSHPSWDISKPLAAFAHLVAQRNRDHKIANPPTMQEICEDMQKFYLKQVVPFLSNLGVDVSGDEKYWWKWGDTSDATGSKTEMLLRFVDQIYVNTFRNLTDDGSVSHSHEFFSLFPDFSQLSDPRSVSVIPQVSPSAIGERIKERECESKGNVGLDHRYVYTNIQTNLKNKGLYVPEVDTVVTTLDEALAERDNLAKTCNSENNSKLPVVNPIIAQVEQMKNARILELDALIEKLRDEYHKLTASVDQIQSTPITKPDNIVNNYEPPVESFAMQLFQAAHTGEWVFVSFVTDLQASIRRIISMEKLEPSGRVENVKSLNLVECCNSVLRIFASDSKYLGKALFMFRAGQLFGESARTFTEENRWIFDLLLDHPTRIEVAVIDWNCTTTREDLETPALPLVLGGTRVVYDPSPQLTKPSLQSSHPYILYSDFKWIFSQMASSYSTFHSQPTSKTPSTHKLCLFHPQTLKKTTRACASHTLQITHVGSPPRSSIFFVRGTACSMLFYWEPNSYTDNTSIETALRKFIASTSPTSQQLSDLLLGTDKKGFKIIKAKLQQHQIWDHAACIVIVENSRQYVLIATTAAKDTVKLYGFISPQHVVPAAQHLLPTQHSSPQLQQRATILLGPPTHLEQEQSKQSTLQPPTQPLQTQSTKTKHTQPTQPTQTMPPNLPQQTPTTQPQSTQITPPSHPSPEPQVQSETLHATSVDQSTTAPPEEQSKQQFVEIASSKHQQYSDGRVHKSEFILSPSQHFLYLVLGNHHFWNTYQDLGLPALPFPPSPPTFGTPTLNETAQGPIPAPTYKNVKHKMERLWLDENSEKVLGHSLQREDQRGMDVSVLFDPNVFDESHLEVALHSMSIG